MGSESSVPVREVQLSRFPKPIVATSSRYCSPDVLTLTPNFQTSWMHYQNVVTQRDQFVAIKQVRSKRQVLMEGATRVPITNWEAQTHRFGPNDVHFGSMGDDGPVIFQMRAKYISDSTSYARVEFRDAMSGEPCILGFEGHWRRRNGHFWLVRGTNNNLREAVAKVHCPNGCLRSKHHIVISPNMDAALIVMICEFFRDAEAREKKGSSGVLAEFGLNAVAELASGAS